MSNVLNAFCMTPSHSSGALACAQTPPPRFYLFIFFYGKGYLCTGYYIQDAHSSLSPVPPGEPASRLLSSKLFKTFNWILMRSGESYFDKKVAKLSLT